MRCPVCSGESTIFMKGIYDCDKTSVRECSNCKLHFLNPKMSVEEEDAFYRNYYESQKKRQTKAYSLDDIQKRSFDHYVEYYDVYHELIKESKDILEIGSGVGGFLRFIERYSEGRSIHSIERSQSNLEYLREKFPTIGFHRSFDGLEAGKFDTVVAFGVFEHIRDLDAFLSEIKQVLKDDEHASITFLVPNTNDALVSFFDLHEYKKFMYMKQHYYVFSKDSFGYIAQNSGLVVKKIQYIQVWGLDNQLSWLNDRKAQDFSRYAEFVNPELDKAYKQNLVEKEMSDLIMVTFGRA